MSGLTAGLDTESAGSEVPIISLQAGQGAHMRASAHKGARAGPTHEHGQAGSSGGQ
jgi:hypothetical protein